MASAGAGSDAGKNTVPAVNLAYGFKQSVFEWMASPEHAWRGQRMGKAMQQLHRMANENVVTGKLLLRYYFAISLTRAQYGVSTFHFVSQISHGPHSHRLWWILAAVLAHLNRS